MQIISKDILFVLISRQFVANNRLYASTAALLTDFVSPASVHAITGLQEKTVASHNQIKTYIYIMETGLALHAPH